MDDDKHEGWFPLPYSCPKCGGRLVSKVQDVKFTEGGIDFPVHCTGCGQDGTVRQTLSKGSKGYDTRNRDAFIERVEAWKEAGRL